MWLLITAVEDGWGKADPLASVIGSATGLAALGLSLWATAPPATTVRRPPPPPVPEWWVDRDEAAAVAKAVLRRTRRWRTSSPVAITAGVHGAGGFGKTTLAKYVAAQRTVQRRFPGGVHLITIGRDVRGRAAVAAKVAEETRRITGDTTETSSDPERAGEHLGRLLTGRPRTLLIIDDVWEEEQLAPFLRGAEFGCVRLVTTRTPSVLPSAAIRIEVDRMSEQQARLLLTHRLPALPQSEAVEALVKGTGRWALLLGIANRFIAEQAATGADPTTAALTLLERLRADGPAVQDPHGTLDLDRPEGRNRAVRASIQAATTLLQSDHAEQRFAELGIFAEDEAVPITLVAALWQVTGGLDETATRTLCKQMADLSLLGIDTTVPGGTITLHDVVRDYLRAGLGTTRLMDANIALLDTLATTLPRTDTGDTAWWDTSAGYLLDHLIEHFLDAGRPAAADAVAQDFRWVRTRLHQRGPTAPWRDLDRIGPPAQTLARQLSQAAHLLTPTDPAYALDAILHSRITNRASWTSHDLRVPCLIDRWPPPDLPDPALIRILTGHTARVNAVVFSPDGTRLATGGDDGMVRVWDLAAGEILHTMAGHTRRVNAAVFSYDGARLVTAGDDWRVRIWDPATGRSLHTLTGHTSEVRALALSPDGTRLVTAEYFGMVRVWDLATGRPLQIVGSFTGGVNAVVFSHDGSRLATVANDGTVQIWDSATGEALYTLVGHTRRVNAVALSPNGTCLVTAGDDWRVRVWDPATGGNLHTLTGHTGAVNAVAFSPDEAYIAAAGNDGTVRVRDSATGRILFSLTGHTREMRAVVFSSNGNRLATADTNWGVKIWDSAVGTSLRTLHTGGVNAVAFSCDGTRLATAGIDGMRIWDPATGETLRTLTGHAVDVSVVAFSPDGTRLAIVGQDRTVLVWNLANGRTLRTLSGFTGDVNAVVYSRDGIRLATTSDDHAVRIWDPATGVALRILTGHTREVRAAAFSADGARLATVGADGTVRVWDVNTGQALAMMRVDSSLSSCAWAPNGRALCVGASGGLFAYNLREGNVH
ncbi:NB-ARC domain-containing protein [Streptomyces sp. NPDC058678]|uniref:NB-ARC domain-containing protein n=1 Tax=Streptomyces sp. NPDC058678 TaxID=3346595 RepID=UPI0036520D54